ncbi:MAG: N-formylglutamate amidohydrolase [Balneolaceae bacterium]|nr:MAG: N-formylglutamate amidohydrolase [Balneolaceae bacterium]
MEPNSRHNLIISCEHACNHVPDQYQHLFKCAVEVLESHRGWDPGSAQMAKKLSDSLNAPLFSCSFTRLLIEPNRSPGHGQLFSEFTNSLPNAEKEHLMNTFYLPYRNRVDDRISTLTKKGDTVLHLSIHTFTPILHGKLRDFEIGVLYDPSRKQEEKFSRQLKKNIMDNLPDLRVKMNQPYKGTDDGFTTYLRNKFEPELYSGIELEVNQKFYFEGVDRWNKVSTGILKSLKPLLEA